MCFRVGFRLWCFAVICGRSLSRVQQVVGVSSVDEIDVEDSLDMREQAIVEEKTNEGQILFTTLCGTYRVYHAPAQKSSINQRNEDAGKLGDAAREAKTHEISSHDK